MFSKEGKGGEEEGEGVGGEVGRSRRQSRQVGEG